MQPSPFLAAAVQMTSGADRAANLATALRLVGEAADRGARLVALPENFAFMGPEEERLAGAEPLDGPSLSALRELARARRVYLLAGSLAERTTTPGKTANTSVLLADDGEVAAVYRKIHLFDVDIPDGEPLRGVGVGGGGRARWWWRARRSAASASRSATTCASRSCTGASPTRARSSCACRPPSRSTPARTTGRCCCAPAPSRTRPTCSPRRRAAATRAAG